jgi:DNA-binding SARP family transcriptional activator
LQPDTLRIYVTGDLTIERGTVVIFQHRLGARQARLLFARLVVDRGRTLLRQELADTLWREDSPDGWDVALNAVVSRLRSVLRGIEGSPSIAIEADRGGYRLRLPADTWIDAEAAANAIDEAEGALRGTRLADAWSAAHVAVVISRRGFLPDEEGAWVERQRGSLQALLRRGWQCLAAISLQNREPDLAIQYANELVALDPFLESGYRTLMGVHAAIGNRAEALRVFARLRELLREELGTSPSSETEAIYLGILQG